MNAPDCESYPGSELSIAQLAYALERKLSCENGGHASIRARHNPQQLVGLKHSVLRSLAAVGGLHNAFSPINRLHPETIAHIIAYLTYRCHLPWTTSGKWDGPYDWIVVTHVCRYWRYTALSFPNIWSIIDASRPNMAQKCLELSKATPLDIQIIVACSAELFQSIHANIARARSVDICFAWEEASPLLSLLSETPAPKLETLRLDLSGTTHPFPLAIVSRTHYLTSLTLIGTALTEPIPHITNLRVLNLENDDDACFTSMTNLLDVLESNPELHFLEIRRAGPRVDDAAPERIVRLDNVARLTLGLCAIKMILGHLALPPTTDLAIRNTAKLHGPGPLQEFLPPAVRNLENLRTIETLIFGNCGKGKCSINAVTVEDEDGDRGSINIFAKAHSDEPNDSFVLKAFRALRLGPPSFEHVTELFLHGLKLLTPEFSGEVLGSMPKLETLVLSDCDTVVFLQALTPSRDKTPFLCPEIRNLTIHTDQKMDRLDLPYFATVRKGRGAPLERVSITCHSPRLVNVGHIISLNHIVPFVDWKIDEVGPSWSFVLSVWADSDSESDGSDTSDSDTDGTDTDDEDI